MWTFLDHTEMSVAMHNDAEDRQDMAADKASAQLCAEEQAIALARHAEMQLLQRPTGNTRACKTSWRFMAS